MTPTNSMTKYSIHQICDSNISNVKGISKDSVISYLDTSSITENSISELQELILGEAPSRAQRIVGNNTILYSLVRPNLRHYGFIEKTVSNLVASTGFLTLNLKTEFEDVIDIRYLFLLLSQPHITTYLHGVAQNAVSAYPSLNPSDVEALEFEFPTYIEQKNVAEIYFSIDRKIALNREINRNLALSA